MAIRKLTTMDAVFDALGGPAAVARLTRSKRPAVSNWQQYGRFPAKTYIVMTRALARKRCEAAPELWGMVSEAAE